MKLAEIYENLIGENYPLSWNIEEFAKLSSFKKRIKYCEERLKRISSGTSRIVYMIDDEKVLKLARNTKGLAQNEIESDYSKYPDIDDILARTFHNAEDNTWVEMELDRKLTPKNFKSITGFDWVDYSNIMKRHAHRNDDIKGYRMAEPNEHEKKIEAEMWEHEFTYPMLSFLGNYDVLVGDLLKLSSYGVVKRNGEDTIVLIDYGLDNNTYISYYK